MKDKVLLGSLFLASVNANAGGLFLQEAVIANAGTVGAGGGVYTESAAALWANPAVMSKMGESKTTVNLTLLDLEIDYDSNLSSAGDARSETFMPAAAFFHTSQVSDSLHLGVAVGSAGGSSIDYGDTWDGNAVFRGVTVTTFQFNPAMSWKVNENFSVAAGAQVQLMRGEVDLGLITTDSTDDWSYGYNLGLHYDVSDELSLGLSYRSAIEHDLDFDALIGGSSEAGLSTTLPMADIWDLSVGFDVTENTTLYSTIQRQGWSDLVGTPLILDAGGSVAGGVVERHWDDIWQFGFAVDHGLSNGWRLKAGVSYETSPLDDSSLQWLDLPAGDAMRYSIGASKEIKGNLVDFYYEFADLGEVDINRTIVDVDGINAKANGVASTRIHFVGISTTF